MNIRPWFGIGLLPLLVMVVACGDDSNEPAGNPGTSGSATSGAGGQSGSAGMSTSAGGQAGTAGMAGLAGQAGSTAGTSGTAGTGGTGGTAGTAGQAGTGGSSMVPDPKCEGKNDLDKCGSSSFDKDYCWKGQCLPASSCVGRPNLDGCGSSLYDHCWDEKCLPGESFDTVCWDVMLTPSGQPNGTTLMCDSPNQWYKFKMGVTYTLKGTDACPDGKTCATAAGYLKEFNCVKAYTQKSCNALYGPYVCCNLSTMLIMR
jgi:hypothetical protein